MLDTEKLWRDAPAESTVCTLTKTTKNMVLGAIMDGADDFESVRKLVPLCNDNECAQNNASGRGCRENTEALLSIYVPVYALMTAEGGCSKAGRPHIVPPKNPECGKKSDGCGGCTLCGD